MGKITYDEIKKTFPEEKKTVESLYGRIIPVRKISYWFTLPLLKMNVSAFQASVISMLIAIIACMLIAVPNIVTRITGIILVPIWHVFDCVDGNIARYRKTTSDFGSAVDAICGYFIGAFLPLSLGVASWNLQLTFLNIPADIFIILGALACISEVMMRLIHQKYAFEALSVEIKTGKHIEKGDNQYELTGFNRIRKMADVEMGVVGLPMFALWLCPVFNFYHILTLYYCLTKVLSLFVITGYYLRKCKEGN